MNSLVKLHLEIFFIGLRINSTYGLYTGKPTLSEEELISCYREMRALRGIIRHIEEGNTIGM